ncbi:MAG TPA: universal stress protein [Casimicrobiaceae bacterium]|jgi:nucleotide-binding universal stress UspA family protein
MAYHRILVPVDGSAASQRGVEEALRLAQALDARVSMLHVLDSAPIVAAPDMAAYVPQVIDDLRLAGQQIAEQAKARADAAGVGSDVILADAGGRPVFEAIIEQAQRVDADLLVMGTHGRRGIARVLMGSDAEGVVRNARVPVMLVRGPEEG